MAEGKVSVSDPVSKFEGAGLSRKIGDGGAEGLGHGAADFAVSRAAEENGLEGVGLLEVAKDRGEGGGIPAFGGSVGHCCCWSWWWVEGLHTCSYILRPRNLQKQALRLR